MGTDGSTEAGPGEESAKEEESKDPSPNSIESALARRIAQAKVKQKQKERAAFANTVPIPIVKDPNDSSDDEEQFEEAQTLVDIKVDPSQLKGK
jgi:myo-inositol-1-phosphate synthase